MDKATFRLCLELGKRAESLDDFLNALTACEKDVETMTLEELEEYHATLEERYDFLLGEEPDESDDDAYEEWEDELCELEDEMDYAQIKIDAFKKAVK